MTEHSKKWRDLAAHISKIYERWQITHATTIGGSVARGIADNSSDVDIFIFCNELPSEEASQNAITLLKGERWKRHNRFDRGIARDCFALEDARIDVEHVLITKVETELDRILKNYETDRQQFVGGFYDCIPLSGHHLAETWINRVKAYPNGLQTAMVTKHLFPPPLWLSEIYDQKRGDFLFLQRDYVTVTEHILGMLLGLNRLYKPGEWKRVSYLIDKMTLAPENLWKRLSEPFRLPTPQGIASLTQIVEETFDLIEKHLPHINIDDARKEFRTDTDMET